MKTKKYKSLIAILLAVFILSASLPLTYASESSYYMEDFENFRLETFTANSENYTLKLGQSDTGSCLDIHVNKKGNATSNIQYVTYKNLSMKDKVTINFDFMTTSAFSFEGFFNDGKKADIFNHLADGRGSFAGDYSSGTRAAAWYDEKGGENIVRENEWYSVTLNLDLTNSTYTYLINGKPGKNLKNGYTEAFETIQLPANSSTLTGFGIVGLVDGIDISIDNIEIYSGDPLAEAGTINTGLAYKLTALGILESAPDETASVTKADFTKMLLNAMGITPVNTNPSVTFSDTQNHPDLPYLDYAVSMGILGGKGDGTLGPDDTIDIGTAAKMAVSALGAGGMADTKGGYQAGYLAVAKRLDLLDYMEDAESFTYKEAMQMIWNFLEAPALDMYGNTLDDVMYEYLGLCHLVGEVISFDPDSLYISLDVSEENGVDVNKTETFRIPSQYALFNWDGVIAEVYMDAKFKVLYIEPYLDASSRYGYLSTVNGTVPKGYITASSVRKIELFDGSEYRADNNTVIMLNGTTASSLVLENAFVHLVLDKNRIISMNVINDRVDPIYGNMLKEGGIINSSGDGELRFTSGENNYGLISDADNGGYTVVVGGTCGKISQLKKGMLFDYKVNPDGSYFFVATNKVVSGKVTEFNNDVIRIADTEYLLSDMRVYVMESGEDYYRTDYPIEQLLGLSVSASLDPKGNVRYIRIDADEREFYGVVCGARRPIGLSDTRELLICTKKGEIVYKVKDKLDTSYGFVDFDTAADNARDITGAGVYKFHTDLKGEITGIESISWIDSAPKSVNTVGDSSIVGKLGSYYVDTRNIFSLTDKDGQFAPKAVNWTRNLQSAYVHPSAGLRVLLSEYEGDEFYSRVSVITKGYESLYVNGTDGFGYITKVSEVLDENGEVGLKLFTKNIRGKENNIVISADDKVININGTAETYKQDAFVHYATSKSNPGVPVILDYLDLNLPTSQWTAVGNKFGTRLEHYGVFEKIRNNEIYCNLNGTTKGMFMRPNAKINGYVYDTQKGSYVAVPLTDMIGKDVWCITTRSYIAAVICPRQSQ